MRAIVTGGAGFIGSHVARRLKARGLEVLVIDDLSGGFRENVDPEIELVTASCEDDLTDLFTNFAAEYVFHLAAYAAEGLSHHIPVFNYKNNVGATANVLALAHNTNCKHVVFTSSIAAYGHPKDSQPFDESTPCDPCDPYGIAKLACEQHIKAFFKYYGGPDYTIFRPHNVFGPYQNISDPYRNVVGIFMRCAMQGLPMPVFGDGSQTRSFSHIDSVAECIASAPFIKDAKNEVFNVGGDEPMSVKELAFQISECFGVEPKLDYLPPRNEVAHAHCDHTRVRSVFPDAFEQHVPIVEGLGMMASFVKQQPIPESTECPSKIEITKKLPPSWASRLNA